MIKKNHACNKINLVVIYEVIRPVLKFLFFFYGKILYAQKAPKSTKKHQKAPKAQKVQKPNQAKIQKRK